MMNYLTKAEFRDAKENSENVSEDNGGLSFTNRMISFTKQITNKQPLKRGMTITSVIDPFLTDLEDYGEEDDEDYNSLFSDDPDDEEEENKSVEDLNTSAN